MIYGALLCRLARLHAECVPAYYRLPVDPINMTNLTFPLKDGQVITRQQSCRDIFQGGGQTFSKKGDRSCAGWAYRYLPKRCVQEMHEDRSCQCEESDCYAACVCHMAGDDSYLYCYTQDAMCTVCSPGSYLLGCGCIQCDPYKYKDNKYPQSIYNFVRSNDKSCDARDWVCGTGSCHLCPKGHRCFGGFNVPEPCSKEWYQDEEGKAECKACMCPPNTYRPTTDKLSVCGPITPPHTFCKPCDRCTDETTMPTDPNYNRCPTRNYAYGRFPDNTCKPCVLCSKGFYSRATAESNYCNMDSNNCKQYYYDNADIAQLNAGPQTNTTRIHEGGMPFVLGRRRVEGTPLRPGPPSNTERDLAGLAEVLPHYLLCATPPSMANTMSALITSFPNSSAYTAMHRNPWSYDCDPHLTAQCKTGFWARMSIASTVPGVPFLSDCVPCAVHSHGGGARLPECTCDPGYAKLYDIKAHLGGITLTLAGVTTEDLQHYCVHCESEVLILDRQHSVYRQEAIQCLANSTAQRCVGTSLLSGRCTSCNASKIPNPSHTACRACGVDEVIKGPEQDNNYYQCIQCDTYHEYPTPNGCVSKRTSCDPGYYLQYNPLSTADSACPPCPADCPSGQIKIMYANRESGNDTCSGDGQSFFQCFDLDADVPPSLPANTRYTLEGDNVRVQTCSGLPLHASWVTHANAAGRQCYFACDYGVHAVNGPALHQNISNFVHQHRKDLKPFLVTQDLAQATPASPRQAQTWGFPDTTTDRANAHNWIVYSSLSLNTNCPECSRSYRENTFLFLEDVVSSSNNVCLSAASAFIVESQCPQGFTTDETVQLPPCARYARGHLHKLQGSQPSYVVLDSNNNILCRGTSLSSFERPCTKHCLNNRYTLALNYLNSLDDRTSMESARANWLVQYLYAPNWKTSNPYTCDLSTCAPENFRYSLSDHSDSTLADYIACIPCARAQVFCDDVFRPETRYADTSVCTNTTNVCLSCPSTKDHAVLIRSNTPITTDILLKNDWILKRQVANVYAQLFGSTWDTDVKCRYTCSLNYTSNNLNPTSYNQQPCITCEQNQQQLGPSSGCFLSTRPPMSLITASVQYSGYTCGASENNYVPYFPRCEACAHNEPDALKGKLVYGPLPAAISFYTSADNCLALCDPSRFHTILRTDAAPQLWRHSYVERARILRCDTCDTPQWNATPCNGTHCLPGYYYHNDTCQPCTVDPCPHLNEYREKCGGHTQEDARCIPCPASFLEDDGQITRQWVNATGRPVSANMSQCFVACLNNHVWLDASNRAVISAVSYAKDLHCVPCESSLIRAGLPPASSTWSWPTLYSMWNSSNVTEQHDLSWYAEGSALYVMREHLLRGACYFCPPHTQTRDAAMCEMDPGYTGYDQGSHGTEVIVTPPTQIIATNPSSSLFNRRLLQTSDNTRVIKVRVQPYLPLHHAYFACCNTSLCKRLEGRYAEKKKNLFGTRYGHNFCDTSSVARRRLLQQEEGSQACYSGSYKTMSGDGPCNACPYGASTPLDGSTSASDCRCLPGYRAIRENGLLKSCTECGFNMYRHGANDTECLPCPPHQNTPTKTSAYCYCMPGYYRSVNDTCMPCEPGYYCPIDQSRQSCPPNSHSPPNASTRAHCRCNAPSYFGDLSDPSSTCVYVHPGFNCTLTPRDCPCARGWLSVEGTCVSSCARGHYAVLDKDHSILDCVPCPLHTYTSTNMTIFIPQLPQQCTPCPPGTRTSFPAAPSVDFCVCFGVSINATCTQCPANHYYTEHATCHPCPSGTSSPPASLGISSCTCPPGHMLTRDQQCEPCPLGYFSSSLGHACISCGSGMTTWRPGATSRLQCRLA